MWGNFRKFDHMTKTSEDSQSLSWLLQKKKIFSGNWIYTFNFTFSIEKSFWNGRWNIFKDLIKSPVATDYPLLGEYTEITAFTSIPQRTQKYLDGLVGVCDEGDEERQHHVYEEGDEGVEVRSAEEPHQSVFVLQLGKRSEHVVTIQQGEQAFCHTTEAFKLGHKNITEAFNFILNVTSDLIQKHHSFSQLLDM